MNLCPNCLRPMSEWLGRIWLCRACNLKVKVGR